MGKRIVAAMLAITMLAGNPWYVNASDKMNVDDVQESKEIVPDLGEKTENAVENDKINWDEYEGAEKTIYLENPVFMELTANIFGDYTIIVQDESVCKVEAVEGAEYLRITGLKEGTSKYLVVSPHDGGVTCYMYGTITVKSLPEDGLKMNDPALYQILSDVNGVDKNRDGYISISEMQNIRTLNLGNSWNGISDLVKDWSVLSYVGKIQTLMMNDRELTDLSILGYFHDLSELTFLDLSGNHISDLTPVLRAENLEKLYMGNNPELSNISILQNLDSLLEVGISDTAVSMSDRMEFGGFRSRVLLKPGEELQLPKVYGLFDDQKLEIVQETGFDVVAVDANEYGCSLKALKGGTSRLQVSCKDETKTVVVVVEREEPEKTEISVRQEIPQNIKLDKDYSEYILEIEDETVCVGEVNGTNLKLTGKKDGVTVLRLINRENGTVEKVFEVAVESWPEEKFYTDYSIIWESKKTYTKEEADDMEVRSVDPLVSTGEKIMISNSKDKETYHVGIRITGKKHGRTVLFLEGPSGVVYDGVQAVVSQLPEDGIVISDENLREALLASADMNKNMDGYISESEMKSCWNLTLKDVEIKDYSELEKAENLKQLTITQCGLTSLSQLPKMTKLTSLTVSDNGLKDLQGIEKFQLMERLDASRNRITNLDALEDKDLKNLSVLYLSGNTELTSVQPLKGLKNLKKISLDETDVSAEARFDLAGCSDCRISQGSQIRIPKVEGTFGKEFSVKVENGEEIVSVEQRSEELTVIKGVGPGKVTLEISYGDVKKAYDIEVAGQDPDQPVGEKLDLWTFVDGDTLTASGYAWKLYPEVGLVAENVRNYVAQWIECIDGREFCEYIVDSYNVVWKGHEKMAENNSLTSQGYAYSYSDNSLTNLRNKGNEVIQDVGSWVKSGTTLYILKKDGTLWYRQEVLSDKEADELKFLDKDVKDLNGEDGYIKNDRSYWQYGKGMVPDYYVRGIDICTPGRGFYGTDQYYYYIWTDQNTGERSYIQIEHIDGISGAFESTERMIDGEKIVFMRVDGSRGEGLYKITKDGAERFLDQGCILNTGNGEWLYQLDGKYYDENQKECDKFAYEWIDTRWNGRYVLEKTPDGSNVLKNDVMILTNVVDIWKSDDDAERIYALRTDGTVWNITDVPAKLTSIIPYMKGDINEDGKIDLQDLRTILRNLCGKVELTGIQEQAADVQTDGVVDLQDLRKLLRYICRKIDTL